MKKIKELLTSSKTFRIALIVFIILSFLAFVRFVLGGPEDDWICSDGQWVKHGAPAGPAPEGGC